MKKNNSGRIQPVRASARRSNQAGVRQPVWQDDQRLDRSGPDVLNFQVGRMPESRSVRDESQRKSALCIHGHEWVVYSTAMQEHWLMLQCVECGEMGTIDAPSTEEWSEAFHAPSSPYRWHESTRVTERGLAAPRVIRAIDGPRCDCPSQRTLTDNRGYERVPGGIWSHDDRLSVAERAELDELAEFVGRSDLCSRFLPLFVRSCEEHTGRRHSRATHTVIGRIERWDTKGLHCSPSVVARIIREFAAWEPL